MCQGESFGQVALYPKGMPFLVADTRPGGTGCYAGLLEDGFAFLEAFAGFGAVAQVAPGLADFSPDEGFDLGGVSVLVGGGEGQAVADVQDVLVGFAGVLEFADDHGALAQPFAQEGVVVQLFLRAVVGQGREEVDGHAVVLLGFAVGGEGVVVVGGQFGVVG